MGLFKKETLVCEQCGKQYEGLAWAQPHLCPECKQKANDELSAKIKVENEEKELIKPLKKYRKLIGLDMPYDHEGEEYKALIKNYRERMDAYKKKFTVTSLPEVLSDASLQNFHDNGKKMPAEEINRLFDAIGTYCYGHTIQTIKCNGLFVMASLEDVYVDASEVFAIVTKNSSERYLDTNYFVISCLLLTRDPFIPVLPGSFLRESKLFERARKGKELESIGMWYFGDCTNLEVPICRVKDFKKMVKQGNINLHGINSKFVLEKADDLENDRGLFHESRKAERTKSPGIITLSKMGYLNQDDVNRKLGTEEMFRKSFWKTQVERYNKEKVDELLNALS